MTEKPTFYPKNGYVEARRGREDGFDRVYFANPLRHSQSNESIRLLA